MIDAEFWRGFLAGLALPTLLGFAFIGLLSVFMNVSASDYQRFVFRTALLLAIASNVILMGYFKSKGMHHRRKGVTVITMIWLIAWFIIYMKILI